MMLISVALNDCSCTFGGRLFTQDNDASCSETAAVSSCSAISVQEIKHLRAVVRSKEEALAETSRQLEAEQAQVMELETQLLAQVLTANTVEIGPQTFQPSSHG
jgi:hypothetical protein